MSDAWLIVLTGTVVRGECFFHSDCGDRKVEGVEEEGGGGRGGGEERRNRKNSADKMVSGESDIITCQSEDRDGISLNISKELHYH